MNEKLVIPMDLGGIMAEASRDMLIAILDSGLPDWNDGKCSRGHVLVSCREELVRRFPCQDCGAEAGQECKPDYGCEDRSRRYPPILMPDGEEVPHEELI